MRRLFALLFGMVLGGAAMYVGFKYHVVRVGEKKFLFVPKQQAELKDAYVDIRNWDSKEWKKHPELIEALRRYGRADLVKLPEPDFNWMEELWKKWWKSHYQDSPPSSTDSLH